MIASLKGLVAARLANEVIIEVGGVGYRLLVPARVLTALPDDHEVTLHTHLHVHDNRFQLYGFMTHAERELFERLISVSGIGPRVALSLISAFSSDELKRAVVSGNTELVASVPGIGRKTAQRLVLELGEKLAVEEEAVAVESGGYSEAHHALLDLGYSAAEASSALQDFSDTGEDASAEAWLRFGLKNLASHNPGRESAKKGKKVSRA